MKLSVTRLRETPVMRYAHYEDTISLPARKNRLQGSWREAKWLSPPSNEHSLLRRQFYINRAYYRSSENTALCGSTLQVCLSDQAFPRAGRHCGVE